MSAATEAPAPVESTAATAVESASAAMPSASALSERRIRHKDENKRGNRCE